MYYLQYILRPMYIIHYMDAITLLLRLGRSLRDARRRRGLTQAQLAEIARLPRLKIIQVERGDASVSVGAYARTAAAMGLELVPESVRRPTLDDVGSLFDD